MILASAMNSSSDMEPSLIILMATSFLPCHLPYFTTPNCPVPRSLMKVSKRGSISHVPGVNQLIQRKRFLISANEPLSFKNDVLAVRLMSERALKPLPDYRQPPPMQVLVPVHHDIDISGLTVHSCCSLLCDSAQNCSSYLQFPSGAFFTPHEFKVLLVLALLVFFVSRNARPLADCSITQNTFPKMC